MPLCDIIRVRERGGTATRLIERVPEVIRGFFNQVPAMVSRFDSCRSLHGRMAEGLKASG